MKNPQTAPHWKKICILCGYPIWLLFTWGGPPVYMDKIGATIFLLYYLIDEWKRK